VDSFDDEAAARAARAPVASCLAWAVSASGLSASALQRAVLVTATARPSAVVMAAMTAPRSVVSHGGLTIGGSNTVGSGLRSLIGCRVNNGDREEEEGRGATLREDDRGYG
jgi:hypothetical protein